MSHPRGVVLVLLLVGTVSVTSGCGEQEKIGLEVADALCADPAPLQQAAQVTQALDKGTVTSICNAFTASMESKGVKMSRAKLTLGSGGKAIWEKTISARIAKQCPAAREPAHVGALVSVLLACKPMGIW
jgi:hypothetical protein